MKKNRGLMGLLIMILLITTTALIPPYLYQRDSWMVYFQYSNTVSGTDVLSGDAVEIRKLFTQVGGKNVSTVKVSIYSNTLIGVEIQSQNRRSESEIIIMTNKVITQMNEGFLEETEALKVYYQDQLDQSTSALISLEALLTPELKWEDKDYLKAKQDNYNAKINLIIVDQASQSFDSYLRVVSRIRLVSKSIQGALWAVDLVLGLVLVLMLSVRKHHE